MRAESELVDERVRHEVSVCRDDPSGARADAPPYPMIGCMSEHEVLSWARYGEAARELTDRLRGTGFTPDVVLGVARGGMVLAASLAYGLDCKNLFSVNVEFYTGEGTTLDAPVMLPPLLDPADLLDMRVLVVDDVADSGKTLELVLELCHGHVRRCGPRCCTRSRPACSTPTWCGSTPTGGSTSPGPRPTRGLSDPRLGPDRAGNRPT